MSLVILTRSPKTNPLSLETYKGVFRRLTKRKRGPQAVTASLIRGLDSLHYNYKINPSAREISPTDTIWVNESLEALRWGISFKQKNPSIKLVVGPNLVVTPKDNNGIIFDKNIDIILQPSEWTKKLYESYDRDASAKIKLWQAGVMDPYEKIVPAQKENFFIVYQKNAPQDLFELTIQSLAQKGIPVRVINYGSFKHEHFLSLLDKAVGMIYLSSSESQGLALQEAWIRNVPTLTWDRGYWEHEGVKFEYPLIGSPFLTPDCGISFANSNDFQGQLDTFIQRIPEFRARTYCIENLSDKVTTAKYLDIIRA